MEESFITKIMVHDVRDIHGFEIPLSEEKRMHLILTGKNGSGKTSVLNELRAYLEGVLDGTLKRLQINENNLPQLEMQRGKNSLVLEALATSLKQRNDARSRLGGTTIEFSFEDSLKSNFEAGNWILALFGARRSIQMKEPKGIQKVTLKQNYKITDQAGSEFIQYIVNQKADRSFAKDDNDSATAQKIDTWFNTFEASLQSLFDCPELKLEFDRKNYNFNLIEPGKAPYNLNQLSDGYSAILGIVTDLIIRMEEHRVSSYDVQGVVLIDEIETHLHIDLQKKILPFLTAFFPRVQFIVTTHSPFVLNSIENAVICDLEKRIVTTDLSGYSYDTLIESYFDSDKYSDQLKTKVLRYETLATAKEPLSEAESTEVRQLQRYLDVIPKFVSDELAVKLQQIKLQQLKRRA